MRVGMVGWRGMVGSVLMQRMRESSDFEGLELVYFSTSQVGGAAPSPNSDAVLRDAYDLDLLRTMDVVLTCQGGSYTERVYGPLRDTGWAGYWIDAASTLRLSEDAIVVLDPVNGDVMRRGIEGGVRTLVGGNCTVSLMLMAVAPLFRRGWVEWLSSMTYQAVSGAGAAAVQELAAQTQRVGSAVQRAGLDANALSLEAAATEAQRSLDLPTSALGAPLVGNVLPWVDRAMPDGRTREEWKGEVECQRILDLEHPVPIDGVCVRVAALRCHAQALTIKLREEVDLSDIEREIRGGHEWVDFVPNDEESTLERLHPAAVTGDLTIAVGRLRKMRLGTHYVTCFTVGDQLLWGAAEPLRRSLAMVRMCEGRALAREVS